MTLSKDFFNLEERKGVRVLLNEFEKRILAAIFVVAAVVGLAGVAVWDMAGNLFATRPYQAVIEPAVLGPGGKFGDCTNIQSGELLASDGSVIETGFDQWGYNYQGRMFNGYYCDAYRDAEWCQEWKDVRLQMKWNDAWLDNKDCSGDKLLDRHYGFDSYVGSGAWLTNHQSGEYELDGENCNWNYFVKIVAAPTDATSDGGIWYAADGTEIGPVIWGSFATIQQVENDPCAGIHGSQYISPVGPGFGKF